VKPSVRPAPGVQSCAPRHRLTTALALYRAVPLRFFDRCRTLAGSTASSVPSCGRTHGYVTNTSRYGASKATQDAQILMRRRAVHVEPTGDLGLAHLVAEQLMFPHQLE
jgi:hypothetical protein